MENIDRCGYKTPREIQKSAIPLILDGYSVKGQAETGSGKTAVSLILFLSSLKIYIYIILGFFVATHCTLYGSQR